MNDSINITYTPATGDLLFTTARQTSGLDEAIKAIGDFIRTLKAEPIKQTVRQVQQATAEVKAEEVKAKPKAKQTSHHRHLWTDDEKREAMRMYADGVDMDIIVEKFHSTPQSVQKIMQKAGVKRPWPTKGNPSKVVGAEPEAEAETAPVPSAEELEAEDRQRKADLKEYRKQHPKPYYLN